MYLSEKPIQVDQLDVESLPSGREVRLQIELMRDAMGQMIRVPVVVLRGKKEGPVFGLTAALHGNELNGIRVIHELFDRIDVQALRGTIVAVIVANVPGYLMHQREFNDGRDLNHLMPGKPNGTESQVYSHRLIERIIKRFDYLIDLHTASFGRINSLYIRADMTNPITARMAYLQRPQIILHNPASDSTLRGTAMELDIPAITVEIGDPHLFQPALIKRSLTGLRAVLSEIGMTPKRKKLAPGPEPIICHSSRWMYTTEGGLLDVFPGVVEEVKEGEIIANIRNIYGDIILEYKAPYDGIIIGKSTNPAAQMGARIAHVGEVGEPDDVKYYTREITDQLAGV